MIERGKQIFAFSHGLGKLDGRTISELFATRADKHAGSNKSWPDGTFPSSKGRRQECSAKTKLVRDATDAFSPCGAHRFRTVSLGKAGSFHANELIGEPYGLAYEIVNQKLNKLPPRTIQELGAQFAQGLELELTHSFRTDRSNKRIDKRGQSHTTSYYCRNRNFETVRCPLICQDLQIFTWGIQSLTDLPYRRSSRNRLNNTQISLSRPNTARKSTRSVKKQSANLFPLQRSRKADGG